MLINIGAVKRIYVVCGYTDMRKSIDGLAAIIKQGFCLNPFEKNLFLFCGKKRDRMKALFWEGDGFLLLYKRLADGSFKWPRNETQARCISEKEFRWLMEGLGL